MPLATRGWPGGRGRESHILASDFIGDWNRTLESNNLRLIKPSIWKIVGRQKWKVTLQSIVICLRRLESHKM